LKRIAFDIRKDFPKLGFRLIVNKYLPCYHDFISLSNSSRLVNSSLLIRSIA
jgi:hypothetical protein